MSIIQFNRRRLLQTAGAGGALLALPAPFIRSAKAAGGVPVNLITTSSDLTKTLFALLSIQGYFEEFGVDGNIVNVADNSQSIPSLISGKEDICVLTGFSTLFPAAARGAKLKVIGGGSNLFQAAIYSKNPAVKSIKDLEGKVVGTGAIGASVYILTVATLRKFGVDPSKVTFRNVGGNAAIFSAVAAGTVDAGASGLDVFDQIDQYGVHVVKGGEFWAEFPNYVYQAAYTTDDIIDKKRDGLVKTLAAFAKLYRYLQTPDSHDNFLKAYATVTGTTNTQKQALSQWNFIQKYKPYASNIAVTEKGLNFTQQLNVDNKVQKAVLPFKQVADMSLAHDALKLLGGPVKS